MAEITIVDVTAFVRKQMQCVLCQGKGQAMLMGPDGETLWKNPRPCPVCRGVGQHSTAFVPDEEQMEDMMVNYRFK